MKKRTKVILGVIIGVLVLYSAFVTLGVYVLSEDCNEMRAELEQKTTDYEILKENYFELHEKYLELEYEKAIK